MSMNNLLKLVRLKEALSSCAIEGNELAIKTLNEIASKPILEQLEIIYKNMPSLRR